MKKQLTVDSYQLSVKRTAIFFILLFTIHYPPSLFPQGNTGDYSLFTVVNAANVDDIVERIQKKYNVIHDIQGTFSQTSYIKDLERVETYSGKFFIKRPSQMRWKYAEPRDEEVIIRESVTWIYKKSEKQVLRTTSSKKAYSQAPIALLESLGNIKADFNTKIIEKDILELMPIRRIGIIKKLLLRISPGDFPIKMLTIFDTYGNKIVIELRDTEINSGLDDSLFTFKIPQGVEVFDFNR